MMMSWWNKLIIKMKAKDRRLEYVDEFRKINTLDKIPPVRNAFLDMLEQKKPENNKFMRVNKEPFLDGYQLNKNPEVLLENHKIRAFVKDSQQQVRKNYSICDHGVNEQLCKYNGLAEGLSKNLYEKKYRYKFFYKSAEPPERIANRSLDTNVTKFPLTGVSNVPDGGPEEAQNFHAHFYHKSKYDFTQINRKIFANQENLNEQLQNVQKVQPMDQILKRLQKYRTLKQIRSINEFEESLRQFKYSLESQKYQKVNRILLRKFAINSIVHKSPEVNVSYLRDIGLPSRDIAKYSRDNQFAKSEVSEQMKEPLNMFGDVLSNLIQESKDETTYLHLLRPSQLSINKKGITFYDMLNISMGRLTSTNAHLCVRHEKVTRAEYEKVARRLEKYQRLLREDGKVMVDQDMVTDQIEIAHKGDGLNNIVDQQLGVSKAQLVNQIAEIRRQRALMKINSVNTNESILQAEIQNRVEFLLNELFEMVAEDLPFKCPLSELHNYVHEINKDDDSEGFDTRTLVWFILGSYKQLMLDANKLGDNLRDAVKIKRKDQPSKTKYLGKTPNPTTTLNTEKLFYKKPNAQKTPSRTNKSKSPIKQKDQVTPLKQHNNRSITPKKAVLTRDGSKSPMVRNAGSTIQKTPPKNLFK